MNFVGLSIQFQTEVGEEHVNHSLLEERQVVLYNRPRGITVREQAGDRIKATLVA